MLITVTQKDIDLGIRKNCRVCPVALAVYRAINLPIEVSAFNVCHEGPYGEIIAPLPPEATRFILDFDAGKEVGPFTFDLPISAS